MAAHFHAMMSKFLNCNIEIYTLFEWIIIVCVCVRVRTRVCDHAPIYSVAIRNGYFKYNLYIGSPP